MDKLSQSGRPAEKSVVHVVAPARLHLGFIDMHGGLGRTFGSLGVCLSDIRTHVSVSRSSDVVIQGPSSHRASLYAGRILEFLNPGQGARITIHEAIPEHAGLGSGTQLSLAIGTAVARLFGESLSTREIARIMQRGARSGIGVGAFGTGGFLVDGGRGEKTDIPPIICHIDFPEAWRFVLILDSERQGVHGNNEITAFQNLPPMSEQVAERLCRLTIIQCLPALAEKDCKLFGAAISEIQEQVGDYFASAQGGRFCSERVAETLPWLQECGASGVGQSSWGPTGFALFDNETRAYAAMKQARQVCAGKHGLEFRVCRAQNQSAEIRTEQKADDAGARLKNF